MEYVRVALAFAAVGLAGGFYLGYKYAAKELAKVKTVISDVKKDI